MVHPYERNTNVVLLRDSGWTPTQIAEAVGATERQVWRWAVGESRPLRVYAKALAALAVHEGLVEATLPDIATDCGSL